MRPPAVRLVCLKCTSFRCTHLAHGPLSAMATTSLASVVPAASLQAWLLAMCGQAAAAALVLPPAKVTLMRVGHSLVTWAHCHCSHSLCGAVSWLCAGWGSMTVWACAGCRTHPAAHVLTRHWVH